ncbi:HAD family hydrolase [Tissierella creatinini]|nr:HAD family hydrolase [Tissierella creatinini]TJX61493.1 HAD family hydrolase [Soehngenia saccharolytica]
MNVKKYILFDLDGTVTDPMLGITKSVQYALNKFEININNLQELTKFIGPPLKDSFMDYYNFTEEEAQKAISYYREYYLDKGIYENFVYEKFENILISLREANKTIIIATTKPTVFAEKILEHFKLKTYFDFVAGSNLDGSRSKKADVIRYALDQNKIENLSEVIMIGDRKHDIIGAKEVGIDSVGVLYGYGSFEELSQNGADYIVKDVEELGNLLGNFY